MLMFVGNASLNPMILFLYESVLGVTVGVELSKNLETLFLLVVINEPTGRLSRS